MHTKKKLKSELAVLYLDANILIFAALNTEEVGDKAVALLSMIQSGEEQAVTSALTFDEVFWEVKRNRGLEKAIDTAEAILNFPNLAIVPADRVVVSSALGIIRKYQLAPRDAIHAATAIAEKVDFIASTDNHFDRIKELKRKSL
jgi:predicted nucleic acid-binding protein